MRESFEQPPVPSGEIERQKQTIREALDALYSSYEGQIQNLRSTERPARRPIIPTEQAIQNMEFADIKYTLDELRVFQQNLNRAIQALEMRQTQLNPQAEVQGTSDVVSKQQPEQKADDRPETKRFTQLSQWLRANLEGFIQNYSDRNDNEPLSELFSDAPSDLRIECNEAKKSLFIGTQGDPHRLVVVGQGKYVSGHLFDGKPPDTNERVETTTRPAIVEVDNTGEVVRIIQKGFVKREARMR